MLKQLYSSIVHIFYGSREGEKMITRRSELTPEMIEDPLGSGANLCIETNNNGAYIVLKDGNIRIPPLDP